MTNERVAKVFAEPEIQKSGGDQRDYRALMLDNGMKVLLVSDPKTDKSSAAMDVNIGRVCICSTR